MTKRNWTIALLGLNVVAIYCRLAEAKALDHNEMSFRLGTGNLEAPKTDNRVHSCGLQSKEIQSHSVPAADFEVGELTPTTLYWTDLKVYIPDRNIDCYRLYLDGPEYYTIAYMEAFDLSESNTTGGLINVVGGGVGSSYVSVDLYQRYSNTDINLFLVVYVTVNNCGNCFRIGRVLPQFAECYNDAIFKYSRGADHTIRLNYFNEMRFKIGFIQFRDNVYNGQGSLVDLSDAIGSTLISFRLKSGIGENLDIILLFCGQYEL